MVAVEYGRSQPAGLIKTVECLADLISFDTTSRNSNIQLIEWAADRFEKIGARLRYDYNADRTKANLFATFGEGDHGGIVLSGHTDVVPVDGQHWQSDPFVADIRDGRVYGRGASDMKGFIAVVLANAELFATAKLAKPVHIALTYDEEVGCLGVPGLIAEIERAGIRPAGCIVGEPTSMRVIGAHKAGRIYRCRVRGCAAHSSLTPKAVNAIEYASKLISHIQDLAEKEESHGTRDNIFDVPFSTISTNNIVGGSADNIIPANCEFVFDYRLLPGLSPDPFIESVERYANEVLLPKMRRKYADAAIDFECIGNIPALDGKESDEIYKIATELIGQDRAEKVAYGTEAAYFQQYGVPSIVCGPGSIEQAHKADEYVTLDQLAACERFIVNLVGRIST
ncbi:acetylornithine deacetylase [Cupriavidus sp. 8B]